MKIRYLTGLLLTVFLSGCAIESMPSQKPVHFQSANHVADVPVRFLHTGDIGRLPLVNLYVGKQAGWWLLDTGASNNLISQVFADSLKLPKMGQKSITVVGGAQTAEAYLLPTLQLGEAVWEGQMATAMDLSAIHLPENIPLMGILGMPALKQLVLQLDFPHKRARFSDAEGLLLNLPASNTTALFMHSGVPAVEVSLAGYGKGHFILDTGNAGGVVLPPDTFGHHRVQMTTLDADDLGGKVAFGIFTLPEVRVAGLMLRDVPASVPLSSAANRILSGVDGSLGNALFMSGTVIMDFPHKQLVLLPRSGQQILPGGFGFTLDKASTRITTVLPNSPAAHVGLKAGDRIISMDGHNVSGLASASIWETLEGHETASLDVEREGHRLAMHLQREHFLPAIND